MKDKNNNLFFKNEQSDYLSSSKYIDCNNTQIINKANEFKSVAENEIELVKKVYEYVRDEIKHSWDVKDRRVTAKASEVLEQKVGICYSKSNLLAALLRVCGIPTGICYQRLTLGETPETGFCIHALNVVYLKSIDRWIRLDARGNKSGVDAQMNLEREQLAFKVRKEIGEVDYRVVYAESVSKLMNILERNDDAIDMYLSCLPNSVYDYKRATIDDIEELIKTRIMVLRAANKLSQDTGMSEVERQSYNYYQRALENDEHVACLVYDEDKLIGTGGVSFYQVMPTYHNPSGRKAYIMNMYTAPEYRRQGIATQTLDLLVNEAKRRGISCISLEATQEGRFLYEKYGFVQAQNEMEL